MYDGEVGAFEIPKGTFVGKTGWRVNTDTVAKFINKDAPGGGTTTRVAVIKPMKLLKIVARGLGDSDGLDVLTQGPPSANVHTSYCVENGTEGICHCTAFTSCSYRLIAGDTGAKLVCKSGGGDPSCQAGPSTTTSTSTTTTSSSTTTTLLLGCFATGSGSYIGGVPGCTAPPCGPFWFPGPIVCPGATNDCCQWEAGILLDWPTCLTWPEPSTTCEDLGAQSTGGVCLSDGVCH